jgi:hypothetical protein
MLHAGNMPAAALIGCITLGVGVATVRGESIREGAAAEAYVLAEGWVLRGMAPASTVAMRVDDVVALHVALRFEGVLMGQATANIKRPAGARDVNISPMLIEAVAGALRQTRQSIVKIATRPGQQKMPTKLEQLAPLLTLDLQFALPPTPIKVAKSHQIANYLVLHQHGLASNKDQRWAWVFPGTAVGANLSLRAQLARLLTELNIEPAKLTQIGQPDGPPLYRFECVHLVRPKADGPLEVLSRGQRIKPTLPPDHKQLRAMADSWAEHLLSRMDVRGRFAGTYLPTSDQYKPAKSSPADAALACMALARYAKLPHVADQRRGLINLAVKRGIITAAVDAGLFNPKPGAGQPNLSLSSTANAAMVLLATLESPVMADQKDLRERCASALLGAIDQRGGFRVRPHAEATLASRPTHALITYALVRMYDQTRDTQYLDAGRSGLVALWKNTPVQRAVGAMPWAALAELNLLQRGKSSPGLLIVRQACDAMWKMQVPAPTHATPATPGEPGFINPDTVGGFRIGGMLVPEPTWQSANALIALGAALPIESFVTKTEQPRWVVDGITGLGFVHRLAMSDDAMWYVHNAARARHGIRTALFDNRQPLSATAMALLATTQWQQSLVAIEKNRASAN